MRCIWRIAHVKWQDHIPNTEVREICKISGIEAFLISAQLRSTGHVIRMSENRLPKQAFYSQLEHGTPSRGGQRNRYKDMLKHNLKVCSIDPKELETLGEDRSSWRAMCKTSVQHFKSVRVANFLLPQILLSGPSYSTLMYHVLLLPRPRFHSRLYHYHCLRSLQTSLL